ncbi:MAG: hypothetical protein LBV30_03155 [Propionibacteriaceae bacterium]|jgi:hypothetical protein|nr:hypothetical protein [Propionibacteriaceae bacterium]
MSHTDLTTILDDLAAGRIDSAEAKRRIDALNVGDAPADQAPTMSTEWPLLLNDDAIEDAVIVEEEPDGPAQDLPPKADQINGVAKVLIRATGRRVKVLADENIATAAAEDVHQVKRKGSLLMVIGDREFSGVIDALSWARSIRGLDDVKALGIGKELIVRVNPALEVDLELTGSSLTVVGLPHLGKVRLTAGAANISQASQVSDLLLQAGQASISGRFVDGWSRFRCESGQITVDVEAGSDAVIRGEVQLGRISWDGAQPEGGQVTVGRGRAQLDLGVVVGHGLIRTHPDLR